MCAVLAGIKQQIAQPHYTVLLQNIKMTATSTLDKTTARAHSLQVSKMHKTAQSWPLTQLISTKCCMIKTISDSSYAVCANCVSHVAETSTMVCSHQLPWLLHSLVLSTYLQCSHYQSVLAVMSPALTRLSVACVP